MESPFQHDHITGGALWDHVFPFSRQTRTGVVCNRRAGSRVTHLLPRAASGRRLNSIAFPGLSVKNENLVLDANRDNSSV